LISGYWGGGAVCLGMIYKEQVQAVYYVYILLCKDDSYYVGLTNDLIRRLEEHHKGVYRTCYTFKRRPLKLVYYETCPFVPDAEQREKQLKGWSRSKKKALIAQHYHKLMLLSECNNLSHCKYRDI
jgi:predicted GIY-YIG superfamily endonuclease